jgi:hypothetical protein
MIVARPRGVLGSCRRTIARIEIACNEAIETKKDNKSLMATPWPDKPCPYCQGIITDLLMEMVLDADQKTAEYQAINSRKPGGAVTCPYCQGAIEYDMNGEDLVQSMRVPLRYSRLKMEDRAKCYGQVFLNKSDATPEEWVEHDKAMSGAFRRYKYAEDP